MARVDVIMPQMGESIVEGTISKWLKQVGDSVKRDEPILEISTDKVDAEIPAPTGGVLAEIKVAEGKTVPVQSVIAVIETEAGAVATPTEAPKSAPTAAAPRAAPQAAPQAAARPSAAPAFSAPPAPPAPPAGGRVENGGSSMEERLRRRSTPLVRKIAAEHDVDISRIAGSGFAGRVTKQDILSFIERGAAVPGSSASSAPSAGVGVGGGAVVHPSVEAWPAQPRDAGEVHLVEARHMRRDAA